MKFAPSTIAAVMSADREQLRRDMRTRRRRVTAAQARAAAHALASLLCRHHLLRAGRRIGCYWPQGSEFDVSMAVSVARRRHCQLYLPVITDAESHRMEFRSFNPGQRLRRNRFGICEPDPATARHIAARQLDLILLPLLAVDDRGWRLGSGAGFYDRYLRHLPHGRRWRRPRLIGIAYEFQRVALLEPSRWDIPLDALATERSLHYFKRGSRES